MAEILALREALIYCRDHGLFSIRIESDSSQLINAVKNKTPIAELHSVLADIAHLSSPLSESLSFFWISRNQNVVADSLAKDALCLVENGMTPT
ncbi:hypothetical protein Bca101_010494 [Brassica carinata]